MCDTCGCNITPGNAHLVTGEGRHAHTTDGQASVEVLANLLSENDHQAAHNRHHLAAHGVLAINLMSSPGAGKTSLLEATIDALADDLRIAVIEGDLETENDAERIRAHGVPAVQIATGSACHLDAHLVHDALHRLDLDSIDVLFIENVGNLVCPASFDLGQRRNVALLSVPEGDDKPAKYPVMFRSADLVLLTKTDLLPVLEDFSPARAEHYLRQLASPAPFLSTAVRGTASDIVPWLDWLRAERQSLQDQVRSGAQEPVPPHHHDHRHHHHHHHHHDGHHHHG
ncbi:hydrogenase nickel incorporation protein HypB [Rhabdochromatium marinum]|uniref:hydrogenase nickel incorporation protein HypB n=1 Tax=Rhabdochromatium marinum TaxID=48729 RepID=UPI00190354B1|nr:hydrogenase nickel incorporation protein HypB [Rhabdochromatium marinum]MBK1647934.1 hydrogenase accessory protein HypB [Rhabdochromatium marinum]